MGPTASGKTDLAVSLATTSNFEIVSVDSAMIYRGMDIGTAKPSADILTKAPHHLIDIRNPNESYSVAEFCNDANALIDQIHQREKIPLFVGGTIMYFHALQFGITELPAANAEVRKQIEKLAEEYGWEYVHSQLELVDPEAAKKIHPNDAQRIQRALEVFELTGVKLSSYHANKSQVRNDISILNIGLFPEERSNLHHHIELRFEDMIENGVIDELKHLRQQWELTAQMPSMRCIGYRQIWAYLENDISLEEMHDQAVAATRQLAKRQLTWLRHYPDTNLLDPYLVRSEEIYRQIICQLQASNC